MKIGELKEVTFDLSPGFEGYIRTLDLELNIELRPTPDKRSDQSPDFLVVTRGTSGQSVQIGNGWKKLPKSHGLAGDEFLSITIDDPSFSRSLNVAAFHREDKIWDVTWRRRQDRLDTEAA